jgi:hypothetical protein
MASVLDSIGHFPSAEIKPGNFVLIRGRPCKVKNVHHVIFSTPVIAKYGHRTVEIKAVDMITKTNCDWIGYGYTKIYTFVPIPDKLLFITFSAHFVLGLNSKNQMIRIPLSEIDPLRSIISGEKWSGDLHILKIPLGNGKEIEEVLILENVTSII